MKKRKVKIEKNNKGKGEKIEKERKSGKDNKWKGEKLKEKKLKRKS